MKDKYYRENEWWVSPYNFVPEVRGTFDLPAKVSIHDATLRDGEQTPGVVFSVADKIAIAEKLDEVGVDRIEAGMPAVSEQDFQAIKEISKMGLKARIYTFARAIETDETRGFIKAVVDAESGQILGAAVLGIEGGEIMSAIEIAMMGKLSYTRLRDGTFAHPTLAESLNNLFMGMDSQK